MKKFAVVLSVVAIAAFPVMAGASMLLVEQFNYPNGNLVGNGGWTAHNAGGSAPIQLLDGQAILSQGSGSREDANVPFPARGAADVTYAAFKVKVPSAATLGAGDYFAHFRSATFLYPARVYIAAPSGGGDFRFGLSTTSSGTTPIVYWPTGLGFNQEYLVVTSYNAATSTTRLWVDPVAEASPSITSTGGSPGDLINSYALRQGSGSTSIQHVSGILVGTSFADVVGGAVATENSTFGGVKALFR
ncbi:hypothetical protein FJ250_00145 [bacterium]|nr:hypothetical protein [bacterium]